MSVEKVQQIDTELFLKGRVALLPNLEPTNVAEERQRFFAKKKYNPQLTYGATKEKHYRRVVEDLSEIVVPDGALGSLLERRRIELVAGAKAVLAIGTPQFAQHSAKVYAPPSPVSVREALRIHKDHPQHLAFLEKAQLMRTETIDGQGAAAQFAAHLQHYRLPWTVELQEQQTARVKVRRSGKILIRQDGVFNPKRIADIMAHEIDVHVLRSMNAQQQPYLIFQRGTAGYLSTEEGLATLAKKTVSQFKYLCSAALYLVAVDLATKYSFVDTYAALRDLAVQPERAFNLTLRAKRGLSDTALPGAFCKDALYFSGTLAVGRFILKGGDVKKLYYGKIGVDDVKTLAKIPNLVAPRYLPDFVKDFPTRVKQIFTLQGLK